MTKRILLALSALFLSSAAFAAETPNPVTPGYQVCSSASGARICGFQTVDTSHPLPVTTSSPSGTQNVSVQSQYPVSTAGVAAVPVTASATGTTGAVTATLPATAGKTTYLCSVQIGEAGTGTATATATNTITGTLNYVVAAPGNFTVTYSPCVPASAANTTIPVATAANASATAVAVTATGYQF